MGKIESLVKIAERLKVVISIVISGITIILPEFAQYLKIFVDRKNDRPQIGISITDVSEIRKSRRPNNVIEVPFGDNKDKYFIYISAVIKNVGNNELIRLKINNYDFKTSIKSNQMMGIRFKVFSKDGKKIKKSYSVIIEFEDDKNVSYENRYKLKYIPEKKKALIERKLL